jgi:hypothetical protein
MTVFVAFAPADREAAEGLEAFIERRGQFAELDDGQTALRPVQPSDVVVLLLSKDFVFAPTRLRLEQRALDAWTEGRLVLVKLDHAFAPVGLRDLPAIDASFAAQREFKWQEIANAVREKLKAPMRQGGDARPTPPAPPTRAPRKRGAGLVGAAFLLVLAAPGIVAAAASISIWLANRIGPISGGWADLLSGIEGLGMRYGLPAGAAVWVFAAAIGVTLSVFGWSLARFGMLRARASAKRRAPVSPPPIETPGRREQVFVSYARANQATVLPVIEAAQTESRKFWLDQQGIAAGDGWAGEIVRAIKDSAGVMVMCSKAAFESDHVKREIYLADRYRKRLAPVYIEQAEAPEDFEYFFAGVQSLNLFETPEAERGQALMGVLGVAG